MYLVKCGWRCYVNYAIYTQMYKAQAGVLLSEEVNAFHLVVLLKNHRHAMLFLS